MSTGLIIFPIFEFVVLLFLFHKRNTNGSVIRLCLLLTS